MSSKTRVLDVHFEEEPLVACASSAVGPEFEGDELEADPTQVSGQGLHVFRVGMPIDADDKLGAAEVVAARKLEERHESGSEC